MLGELEKHLRKLVLQKKILEALAFSPWLSCCSKYGPLLRGMVFPLITPLGWAAFTFSVRTKTWHCGLLHSPKVPVSCNTYTGVGVLSFVFLVQLCVRAMYFKFHWGFVFTFAFRTWVKSDTMVCFPMRNNRVCRCRVCFVHSSCVLLIDCHLVNICARLLTKVSDL